MTTETVSGTAGGRSSGQLIRSIDWRGAFWVASGVPALVLFSIGGIAGTVGNVAFAIWGVSMVMGFIQSFTYAEIAGLFPNKSGGASVYGAAAWLKYGKFIAPLSVWCNWIAWTPVLSLGSAIAAGYLLNAMEPVPGAEAVQAAIAAAAANGQVLDEAAAVAQLMPLHQWSLFTIDLGIVSMSFNWIFFIGTILMLLAFAIQHRGILGTAKVQMVVGLIIVITLFVIGVVPFFNGNFNADNFSPFVPLAVAYEPAPGSWNIAGWTLVLGAMFIAAWSTYGFETAICYTSEFKNPETDTFKAIFYSGLLCLVLFILVPITVQGYLGLEGMLAPAIADGSGVADAMAHMVGGGAFTPLFVFLIIGSLILIIITAMAGSSRTLYQGSVDGWLPRYLSHVNHNGAPTAAMWTDLGFNLILLAIAASDATAYFFILAVSNCGYIIFNFLNLNSGWIHRMDAGHVKRPFKAPTVILAAGTVLAFVNAAFMGAGAKVWNPDALWYGLGAAALIIPVFAFRHYIQDKGQFPPQMLADLGVKNSRDLGEKKAGMLPYLTLAAGIAVVLIANVVFTLE
ncbi:amino acid/polyamine/organocation transporter (APC superfamily) [Dongia mobilis]|uniref:Amino acid/polyamine/organocation transporter (APC superfamily) n=1 Tax=Dongia mobilis TaxID=578943 RepID=A0A4R6X298_9PROT|nr:APC family permease [Dongia mobilis]TDQ84608.1 amino acid/polyamine/organocation transporter (APC superfamily) [Dongia mobilis]